MKSTLFGSRLTQVFVEVRPKSTLRIDCLRLEVDLLFTGVVVVEFTEFIGVAADGWTVMETPNLS
ncbi:MAG TPA: hypothetical protein V6D48_07850 [Oculatellaceae cyanobacterium]